MAPQVDALRELGAAPVAPEVTFAGVRHLVLLEGTLARERLGAHVTLVTVALQMLFLHSNKHRNTSSQKAAGIAHFYGHILF